MRPWNGESAAASRWSLPRSASKASTALRPPPLTAWYEARSTETRPATSRMRGQRDDRRGRRAVRVGDEVAVALARRVRVRLRHDERDVVGESERARVVDHEGDESTGSGHDLAALRGVDRQEEDVELASGGIGQDSDRHGCAGVGDLVALLVPECPEARGRQAGIGEDGAEDATHHAAGSGNADGRPGRLGHGADDSAVTSDASRPGPERTARHMRGRRHAAARGVPGRRAGLDRPGRRGPGDHSPTSTPASSGGPSTTRTARATRTSSPGSMAGARPESAGVREGMPARHAWNTYVACDDVDAAAERVRSAGGTVVAEPDGSGRASPASPSCIDPAGAAFGLWEPRAVRRSRGREHARRLELQRAEHRRSCAARVASTATVFGWEVDEVDMARCREPDGPTARLRGLPRAVRPRHPTAPRRLRRATRLLRVHRVDPALGWWRDPALERDVHRRRCGCGRRPGSRARWHRRERAGRHRPGPQRPCSATRPVPRSPPAPSTRASPQPGAPNRIGRSPATSRATSA